MYKKLGNKASAWVTQSYELEIILSIHNYHEHGYKQETHSEVL